METAVKGSRTNYGLSDQVRAVALKKYILPAIRVGKTRISVSARDLMDDLRQRGFPDKNWHQICSAIQAEKFLRANGLEIEGVDGPPSKTSSTVVVHFRVAGAGTSGIEILHNEHVVVVPADETPEEWAHRLTGKLNGLLKEELKEFGGGEAFIRWVRGYDEDHAA
jgi:hypothetical protein